MTRPFHPGTVIYVRESSVAGFAPRVDGHAGAIPRRWLPARSSTAPSAPERSSTGRTICAAAVFCLYRHQTPYRARGGRRRRDALGLRPRDGKTTPDGKAGNVRVVPVSDPVLRMDFEAHVQAGQRTAERLGSTCFTRDAAGHPQTRTGRRRTDDRMQNVRFPAWTRCQSQKMEAAGIEPAYRSER